jgi:2-C-methyl-D-erythritol 4-phosphate cytidylyltransferase
VSVRAVAIVAAAGEGRRMGGERKPFLPLAGAPLLAHALRAFIETPAVESIIVALPADAAVRPPSWLTALDARITIVAGGDERSDSVRNALRAVPGSADVVLVHDGARPLLTRALVERCIAGAAAGHGVVAALPAVDTIKEVDEEGRVIATPDRRRLWQVQTPQAFPRAMLVEAHRRAAADGVRATDDAALVERYGGYVSVVPGEPENVKVTTPADLRIAEALLLQRRVVDS